MQLFIKLAISLVIIAVCTYLGRKIPSLAGLVAVMPLTGVIVLIWLYTDNKNDNLILVNYTKGAIFGIFPTMLFYFTAYICFLKRIPICSTLLICFGVWLAGALVHQYIIK